MMWNIDKHVLMVVFLVFGSIQIFHAPASADGNIEESVVKIIVSRRLPDLSKPWAKQSPQELTASGVIIDGRRILTNAHVIAFASQIYVQPYQSAEKYTAEMVVSAPGIDLAILRISDDSFFQKYPSLEFEEQLPRVKDPANVYGYPIGGKDLSITEGIVSRIDFDIMFYSIPCLRIQIDASLNLGNSGGAVVSADKMIGLVASKIKDAESIGYIIPIEEIKIFLKDIEDGTYDGQPMIKDVLFQRVENTALRQRLLLDTKTTGMMVNNIQTRDPNFPLKTWDVITHIGEHAIDNEGHVKIHGDLRLPAVYLIPRLTDRGKIEMTVFRGGRTLTLQVQTVLESRQVIRFKGHHYPSYFVYGPFVFSAVTFQHVKGLLNHPQSLLSLSVTRSPILTRLVDLTAFEGEELVAVFSPLLPHKITKGYSTQPATLGVLSHVNDIEIKNLAQLVNTLRDAQDEFIVFSFDNLRSEKYVFRRHDIEAATEDILSDNGIRHQCSKELRHLWRGFTD